jgi:outer membrane lipoprotein-sorting protein
MMKHMRIFLIPVFVAAMTLPAMAEKTSLSDLSAYLNGLTTAEAEFTQINADGSGAKGKVFIRRPGRMRFEYAAPDDTLVLASGGQVAIFDAKSNQPPEQYPLAKTPLNLILARKVKLDQAKMVVGHSEEGALTIVTAQDPKHPEYGTIALGFTANPIALSQWVVTDQSGAQTTVLLEPLQTGAEYPPTLFSINAAVSAQKRQKR